MGVRLLEVPAQFIVSQAKPWAGAWTIESNPLPEDAKILAVYVDTSRDNVFMLYLQSAVWPEIRTGDQIPHVVSPQWKRVNLG